MIIIKQNLVAVSEILKKKFTNLTVVETIDLATEILEAVKRPTEIP